MNSVPWLFASYFHAPGLKDHSKADAELEQELVSSLPKGPSASLHVSSGARYETCYFCFHYHGRAFVVIIGCLAGKELLQPLSALISSLFIFLGHERNWRPSVVKNKQRCND